MTWIMNPEDYLKTRRKECYTRHGKDTKSKRSMEMCLILIEVTFIVVLRKRGLGRGQIYRFIVETTYWTPFYLKFLDPQLKLA